jgi:hypothetical protein
MCGMATLWQVYKKKVRKVTTAAWGPVWYIQNMVYSDAYSGTYLQFKTPLKGGFFLASAES